jgi:O-methyltransferase involved in polyketide biosynthesis
VRSRVQSIRNRCPPHRERSPEGATEYLQADLRDPDAILRRVRGTLDLSRPVAVMLLGILAHVSDYDEARSIVDRLMAALPSGSYLVVNDGTNVVNPEARNAATQASIEAGTPYISRHPDTIAGYFHALELIEPGVVSSVRWRAEPDADGRLPDEIDVFCGVGRKP